jgi:hypothetical protein
MRTVKQIKATKRNFSILYLKSVLTMLDRIDSWTRNYSIKEAIRMTRNSIKYAILEIRDTNYEHSFYGPQTDVKYECKKSNQ